MFLTIFRNQNESEMLSNRWLNNDVAEVDNEVWWLIMVKFILKIRSLIEWIIHLIKSIWSILGLYLHDMFRAIRAKSLSLFLWYGLDLVWQQFIICILFNYLYWFRLYFILTLIYFKKMMAICYWSTWIWLRLQMRLEYDWLLVWLDYDSMTLWLNSHK